MRAEMDQRLGLQAMTQPEAEGEQRVVRRQRGVVIVGAPVGGPATVGGERDGDVAESGGAEGEITLPLAGRVGAQRRGGGRDGFARF